MGKIQNAESDVRFPARVRSEIEWSEQKSKLERIRLTAGISGSEPWTEQRRMPRGDVVVGAGNIIQAAGIPQLSRRWRPDSSLPSAGSSPPADPASRRRRNIQLQTIHHHRGIMVGQVGKTSPMALQAWRDGSFLFGWVHPGVRSYLRGQSYNLET